MEEKIKRYLKEIEEKHNVKILLACETGSRSWGFPSPDSDYDIRLIYKHPMDWYLSLSEEKDSIDLMFENNEFDISGWDLRKSMRLLWKSNPPLLERLQSKIVYAADPSFVAGIDTLAKTCYSRIATIHHYLSMAKKCFEEIEQQEHYRLKKFFYALRAAIACLWIVEKEEIPPIFFPEMLEGLSINSELKERIMSLITLKATKDESYLHSGEQALFDLIRQSILLAENDSKRLPAGKIDSEASNTFFRQQIYSNC